MFYSEGTPRIFLLLDIFWTIWPIIAWGVFVICVRAIIRIRKAGEIDAAYMQDKKNIRRKRWLYFFAIWFMLIGIIQLDPLQRPNWWIRRNILSTTPIGMSRSEVFQIVESTNGRVMSTRLGAHHSRTRSQRLGTPDEATTANALVRHRFEVLGVVRNFFIIPSNVSAIWIFDGDDVLIDITVGRLLRL